MQSNLKNNIMNGTVTYKGEDYDYELDEIGDVWITLPGKIAKTNFGQTRQINNSEDIRRIVIGMLLKAGY